MKYFFIFILITFPFVSFSQKITFSIRYLSYTGHPVFEGRMPAKNNPRVVFVLIIFTSQKRAFQKPLQSNAAAFLL